MHWGFLCVSFFPLLPVFPLLTHVTSVSTVSHRGRGGRRCGHRALRERSSWWLGPGDGGLWQQFV